MPIESILDTHPEQENIHRHEEHHFERGHLFPISVTRNESRKKLIDFERTEHPYLNVPEME